MKLLSLLTSLLLGAAVLVFLLRSWEVPNETNSDAGKPQLAVPVEPTPPTQPSGATAAIETAPEAAPEAAKPAEPTRLLAREQAEAERSARLKETESAPAPKPPQTKRYFKVKVRDAGTLETALPNSETVTIRIDGIEAYDADETCTKSDDTSWRCGARARAALTRLIRYRAITCTLPAGGETAEFTARCNIGGQDLATWLVRLGWATPKADAEPALEEALAAAKNERLGRWREN